MEEEIIPITTDYQTLFTLYRNYVGAILLWNEMSGTESEILNFTEWRNK